MFTTQVGWYPAVAQVPFDGIKDHGANHVTDMRFGVDGRPAQIDADGGRREWLEYFLGLGQRVVHAERAGGRRHGIDQFQESRVGRRVDADARVEL